MRRCYKCGKKCVDLFCDDCHKTKVLAIDFDGTIMSHVYPEVGPALPDAIESINKLYDGGFYIIIWTCRSNNNPDLNDIEQMVDWLKDNGVKYHKINENADFVEWKAHPKIYADIYIDDKQIGGLLPWKEIYNMITENKKYKKGDIIQVKTREWFKKNTKQGPFGFTNEAAEKGPCFFSDQMTVCCENKYVVRESFDDHVEVYGNKYVWAYWMVTGALI